MYVCPSCHLEQDSKDGFCRDCGTQLIGVRFCDSCGVQARGGEEFCRECGTKLPEIVPFEMPGGAADSSAPPPRKAPSADNTPSWLQGSDPVPPPRQTRAKTATATQTRQDLETPDWLKGPADPVVYPPMPTSRSTTRPYTPPAPVATPAPTQRPTLRGSNPVPFGPAVAAKPQTDTRNRNLQALLGLFLAVLSVIVAGNSIVLGLALVVVTVLVGGKPLLEILAQGLHRVVDWVWEDPVLRKRILDE